MQTWTRDSQTITREAAIEAMRRETGYALPFCKEAIEHMEKRAARRGKPEAFHSDGARYEIR